MLRSPRHLSINGILQILATAFLTVLLAGVASATSHAPVSLPLDWQFPVVEQFLSPVGDPHDFTLPAAGENRGFSLVRGLQRWRPHRGVDLSNQRFGGRVRSPAPGTVLEAGWRGTWGNLVVIGHRLPGGVMVASILAHLKSNSIVVSPGDQVAAGQMVGLVGRTGRATGPHLHFEVRRLGHLNPWLASWRGARALDPTKIMGHSLASALVPNLGVPPHWGWAIIKEVSGSQTHDIGDPDALLSRQEFYSWAARATGAKLDSRSASSRVRNRLVGLGLSEQLTGLASIQSTISAAEAAEALGLLSSQGWIRTVSTGQEVGFLELQKEGLADVGPLLASPHTRLEKRERPLTRAEGALLVKAAQSLASPATAMR